MAEHDEHHSRGHDHHGHGHVHFDEAVWEAMVATIEQEGELLLSFVTDTAEWISELRGVDAPPMQRVVDVGSGPGVGTCALAQAFPDAQIIAVDSSPAMLERVRQRARDLSVQDRVSTHLAELPSGVDDLAPADVVWASMTLHHVGDEVAALRALRGIVEPAGLVAIAEFAEPMRVLPDDLDIGRPGLADRLDRAGAKWFAALRADLTGSHAAADLPSMLAAAGLDVVGSRLARIRLDPPLANDARQVARSQMSRARERFGDDLDDDDYRTIDVLSDDEDPRGVMQRPDVFIAASRQLFVARPTPRG